MDGGHLLAAAGRAVGLGARRRSGRFDLLGLVASLRALLPTSDAPVKVVWCDGQLASTDELHPLARAAGVQVRTVPVRGGRQRGAEALVLLEVQAALPRRERLLLVGDPRRHELALQLGRAAGSTVELVGVAYGEASPAADRLWLRRPEVEACVRDRTTDRATSRAGYRPPRLLPPSG